MGQFFVCVHYCRWGAFWTPSLDGTRPELTQESFQTALYLETPRWSASALPHQCLLTVETCVRVCVCAHACVYSTSPGADADYVLSQLMGKGSQMHQIQSLALPRACEICICTNLTFPICKGGTHRTSLLELLPGTAHLEPRTWSVQWAVIHHDPQALENWRPPHTHTHTAGEEVASWRESSEPNVGTWGGRPLRRGPWCSDVVSHIEGVDTRAAEDSRQPGPGERWTLAGRRHWNPHFHGTPPDLVLSLDSAVGSF